MTREEKENLLREAVDILIKLDNHLMTSRDNAEFSSWAEDLIDNYCEEEPKTDSWSIKDVADTFKKHGLIREQEPCDDAISREDAEEMFRNIRSHLKPQDYKSAEEFNTRDLILLNAEQMIHALPSVTQKSGKWIPVSERLPEDSGEYLVSVTDKEDEDYKQVGVAWFAHPKDYDIQDGEWRELMIDEIVVAWMPKPKAYSEVEE